jgi:hypothetical protein
MHVNSHILQRIRSEFPLRYGLGGIPDEKLPSLVRQQAVPAELLHDVLQHVIDKRLVTASDMPGMVARATDPEFLRRLARHGHAEVRAGVAICPHTPVDEVERLLLDRSAQVRSAAAARQRGPSTVEHAEVHMAILRTKSRDGIDQILKAHPEYQADDRVHRHLLQVFFQEASVSSGLEAGKHVPARKVAEANAGLQVNGDKLRIIQLPAALAEPCLAHAAEGSLASFVAAVTTYVREVLPYTTDPDQFRRSLQYLHPCWAHHVNSQTGLSKLSESECCEVWQSTPVEALARVSAERPAFAPQLLARIPDWQVTNRARYGADIPPTILQQLPFETILQMVW